MTSLLFDTQQIFSVENCIKKWLRSSQINFINCIKKGKQPIGHFQNEQNNILTFETSEQTLQHACFIFKITNLWIKRKNKIINSVDSNIANHRELCFSICLLLNDIPKRNQFKRDLFISLFRSFVQITRILWKRILTVAEMPNKLILYNVDLSPPVRTVKIVAKLIGLELELRYFRFLSWNLCDCSK